MKLKTKLKKIIIDSIQEESSYIDCRIRKKNIEVSSGLCGFIIDWKELKNGDFFSSNLEKHLDELEITDPTVFSFELDEIFKKSEKTLVLNDLGLYHDGYAEFLFTDSREPGEDNIDQFEVDNYFFSIGEPSLFFKLALNDMSCYYDEEWEYFKTLSVLGVSKENFEKVLQQGLYFINRYNPSLNARIYKYPNYYEQSKENQPLPKINKILFEEPLIFYQEAIKINNKESSCLYFYKTLEFFFLMNRNAEYDKFIKQYNGSKEEKRTENFIKEISKIRTLKENELLKKLLLNPVFHDKMKIALKKAKEFEIIEKEEVSFLADKLYSFRNSIVHGKIEQNFELSLPRLIENTLTEKWLVILKLLSEMVIDEFCFD